MLWPIISIVSTISIIDGVYCTVFDGGIGCRALQPGTGVGLQKAEEERSRRGPGNVA